jgi:exonuclease SbcC
MPQSFDRLRRVLDTIMASRLHEFQAVSDTPEPLLLLITPEDVIGFVILGDDSLIDAYAGVYNRFKREYRDRHAGWQRKTLSLVICRLTINLSRDAFFNAIEADIYFCRKYVVAFGATDEEIRGGLLRLPFLPLPTQRPKGLARPPSAQSLLQEIGFSRLAAERIVRTGQYSASSIVNDLMADAYEIPSSRMPAKNHEIKDSKPPLACRRIRSIEISAFRAYKSQVTFDLDAEVVVLYGQNGLGKTSFFDAIDFACTGRIGRLQGRSKTSGKRIKEIARNLDASDQDTYVALQVDENAGTRLVRQAADWNFAHIGKQICDRKAVLSWLTAASWSEEIPRIENLEKLFRATHLFSQDNQELLQKFLTESLLPYDLVTRMFSLEDYASGIKKCDEVLSLLDDRLKEPLEKQREAMSQREEAEQELRRLGQNKTGPIESFALRKLATEANKKLARALRCSELHNLEDPAQLRDQRIILTSTIESTRAQKEQATVLARKWPEIQALRANFIALTSKANALTTQKSDLYSRKTLLEKDVVRLQAKSGQILAALSDNAREMSAIHLFVTAQQESTALDRRMASATAKAEHLESACSNLKQEIATIVQKIREATANREEWRKRETSGESQLYTYRELLDGAPKWQTDCESLTNARLQVEERQSRLLVLDRELQEKRGQLQSLAADLDTAEADLARISKGHTTFIRLLDDLAGHVSSPCCPTCGAKYESQDALLNRIQTQKEIRPAGLQAKADICQALSKAASELNEKTQKLTLEHKLESAAFQQLRDRVEDLDRSVSVFRNKLQDCGLSFQGTNVEIPLQQAESVTARLMAEAHIQAEISERELAQATDRKRVLDARMKGVVEDILANKKECGEIALARAEVGLRIAQSPIGIAIADKSVSRRQDELRNLADGLSKKCHSAQDAMRKAELGSQQVCRDLEAVVAELETIKHSLSEHQNVISCYEMDLIALGLPTTSQAEVIAERGAQLEAQCVELVAALDKIHFLETAIDAGTRSIRVSELKQRIAAATNVINKCADQIGRNKKGHEIFGSLRGLMDGERGNAVSRYISTYGPLASILQGRLRSVYGFGDIRLLEHSGDVHVEVCRYDTWKKPTDYFSHSQIQILMLSLFLAGRLTQTWSGFAPILLDDPVTHFDDLNAYSLVELIRGLVEDQPGSRQFIISTCEDRLFSLLQSKLAYLKNRAIFYHFTSIGSAGPVVKRVGGISATGNDR